MTQARTLLGFDFGEQRIGVATGNSLTASAQPLRTLAAVPVAQRFEAIALLINEWQPDALVVGRPLYPDGAVSPMTPRCERFARQLEGRFGLKVYLVDERYSSAQAQSEGASDLDAEAAAIILRQYLQDPAQNP